MFSLFVFDFFWNNVSSDDGDEDGDDDDDKGHGLITAKMIMRTIRNFRFLLTVIIAMTGPIKAHTVPSSKDSQHLKVQAILLPQLQRNTCPFPCDQNLYSHVAVAVVVGLRSSCYPDWNDCEACRKVEETILQLIKKIQFPKRKVSFAFTDKGTVVKRLSFCFL